MWLEGQGGDKAPGRALETFVEACDLKDHGGSSALAKRYFTGDGAPADMAKARHFFGKACGGQYEQLSCIYLGVMQHTGLGGPPDPATALASMRQGCTETWATRCGLEGAKVFMGKDGLPRAPAAGAALLGVACERGNAWGCGMLGDLLYRGEVVAEDRVRGRELAKKGCEGGEADPGCGVYGAALYHGHGGEKDLPLARKVLRQACDAKHGPSCRILGVMWFKGLGGKQNEVRADRHAAAGLRSQRQGRMLYCGADVGRGPIRQEEPAQGR